MTIPRRCRTTRNWRRCPRPRWPCSRSQATVASRSARSSSTRPSSCVCVPQRGERDRLGDRGEVVGQPDHPDPVADRRVGREVAEPGPGQRERLAHGPGDHEVAVLGQQLERARHAGAAELAVRLVDHHQPVTRRLAQRRRWPRGGSAVPVGLLGLGSSTTAGRCSLDQRAGRASRSSVKSSSRWPTTQSVLVSRAYSGYIEYVGAKLSAVRPGPGVGLEQLEHHLVGAVGRPHLLGGDAVRRVLGQVRRQRGPELGELAVRVAVQRAGRLGDRGRDVGDALGRGAVGVLVDVELDGHVELRRSVGLEPLQLVAEGREVRMAQRPNRTRTAAPWPGRSSASARVTTWSATSASASRE